MSAVTMIPLLDERRFVAGVAAAKSARDADKARALRLSHEQYISALMRHHDKVIAEGGSPARAASSMFRPLDGGFAA